MLSVRGLQRQFGATVALEAISFRVMPGEVVALLGPNGAGKTTCLRVCAGVLEPTSGSVEIYGIDLWAQMAAARGFVGYLPEGAPLPRDLTVREHLNAHGQILGLRGAALTQQIASLSQDLSLFNRLDVLIDTLSKGFRRRVALAASLLGAPKVLLLDEPTDGLDPNQKAQTRALLHAASADRATVISTHAFDDVFALATRVIVIAGGRILVDEPVEVFQQRASAPLTEGSALPVSGKTEVEAVFAALTQPTAAG